MSDRPEVAELIRTHVWQMRDRLEEGNPIRVMDPVFREIFEHHEAVGMDVEETRDGVVVVETSADPRVELLIRQHADRAVSEFVAEGMARADAADAPAAAIPAELRMLGVIAAVDAAPSRGDLVPRFRITGREGAPGNARSGAR